MIGSQMARQAISIAVTGLRYCVIGRAGRRRPQLIFANAILQRFQLIQPVLEETL